MIALTFILLIAAVMMFLGAAGLLLCDAYSLLRERRRAKESRWQTMVALVMLAWSPIVATMLLFRL